MSQQSDITLYTTQTPNGIKISITLEELGIPYKVEKIDISKNTQKEDWFLAINPNGRIPALTDTFTDGKPINLFESGSIMQYLVERYDTEYKISFPKGTREWYEMNNWLFFQNAGVGPMQGQANIAHYGWVAAAGWAGVDIDKFPALKAWLDRMETRDGVEKGRHVPDRHTIKELLKDKAKMEEHAAKSRQWVQAGMKDDAEKQK
ncbi:Glutathione S-transferase-like protein gedE [Curvularia clavata]|uniref:Glutathione S-transferase-like protein gedE n=1 Tax=Curvularia clavata TaxID=95742 RepID=A0A9Q9DUH5_CURCL|nr:Glutathione S-transferase-like protein gedE [Curvularia clavata]